MINDQNWNYSYFQKSEEKAFVSIGADPGADDILYFVTITKGEHMEELFSQDFIQLEYALDFINDKYGHWEFIDPLSSSTCHSCH